MTLLERFNKKDLDNLCLNCGGHEIEKPQFGRDGGEADWTCLNCGTKQLAFIKSKGFRYYAFLLEGSWTSEYFVARSLTEAFRYAKRYYKTKDMTKTALNQKRAKLIKSYMVGPIDGFVLSDWKSF